MDIAFEEAPPDQADSLVPFQLSEMEKSPFGTQSAGLDLVAPSCGRHQTMFQHFFWCGLNNALDRLGHLLLAV